jgi:hypothetical protein
VLIDWSWINKKKQEEKLQQMEGRPDTGTCQAAEPTVRKTDILLSVPKVRNIRFGFG